MRTPAAGEVPQVPQLPHGRPARCGSAGGTTVKYRPAPPDKTGLLELWNNNPLARAFIEAMIAVQPKIAKLLEGADREARGRKGRR